MTKTEAEKALEILQKMIDEREDELYALTETKNLLEKLLDETR